MKKYQNKCRKSTAPEREKVRQRGSSAESRSRTVYAKLESNSEPERARVRKSGSESQWEPKRGVTESHRKTGRASKRARLKPEGTRVS